MSPPEATRAPAATAAALPTADSARDVSVALVNAVKLTTSLLLTWGVALAARLLLPRLLGPERYGELNFADAFAATSFVFLTFGIDTYVRKEVPRRPAHATEFFGGLLVVRLAAAAGLTVIAAAVMALTGRSPEVQHTVYAFAAAQFFVVLGGTLAAFLHANGTVDGLAIVNVGGKVLWGAGLVLTLALGLSLPAIALSLAFAEAFKAAVLYALCRKHLALRFQVDLRAARLAIAASAPFFVTLVSHTLYSKGAVTVLAFRTNDLEVGWYGAASNIAELSLMLTPLIGWVLMPLMSRAAARSTDELFALCRRSMEVVLAFSLGVGLFLGLGADVWIGTVFGEEFGPAALSLRILAGMFVLTYLAVISSNALILLERSWTVTLITLICVAANIAANLVLIPFFFSRLGPSGGAAGSAAAQLCTEIIASGAMLVAIGRRGFSHGTGGRILRMVAAAGAAVAVHLLLAPWGGPAVLLLALAAYLALLFGSRALRWDQLVAFVQQARWQREAAR